MRCESSLLNSSRLSRCKCLASLEWNKMFKYEPYPVFQGHTQFYFLFFIFVSESLGYFTLAQFTIPGDSGDKKNINNSEQFLSGFWVANDRSVLNRMCCYLCIECNWWFWWETGQPVRIYVVCCISFVIDTFLMKYDAKILTKKMNLKIKKHSMFEDVACSKRILLLFGNLIQVLSFSQDTKWTRISCKSGWLEPTE